MLSTVSDLDLSSRTSFHPSLLFVARKRGKQRDYDKEVVPNPGMFEQEFRIINQELFFVNKVTDLDKDRRTIASEDKLFKLGSDGAIILGEKSDELNIVILKSHTDSRSKDDCITLGSMISTRIPGISTDDRGDITKEFSGKNISNKNKMRIKVDVFDLETEELLDSEVSESIVNTDSKAVGALKLYDVHPRDCCSEGGEKVVMMSEFALCDDVVPQFQLWNKDDNTRADCGVEETFLEQPSKEDVVKKGNNIIFKAPPQPNLDNIVANNLVIKIAALRSSDNTESEPFEFKYNQHGSSLKVNMEKIDVAGYDHPCAHCHNYDQMKLEISGQRARPHQKRKQLSKVQCENIKRRHVSGSSNHSPRSLFSDSGVSVDSGVTEHDQSDLPTDLDFSPETYAEMINLNFDINDIATGDFHQTIVTDGRRKSVPVSQTVPPPQEDPQPTLFNYFILSSLIVMVVFCLLGVDVFNQVSLSLLVVLVLGGLYERRGLLVTGVTKLTQYCRIIKQ